MVQQVASDDEPDPKARQKVYLVTKTLSLLYESEALGQLVGPENDFRYFNRALTRAKNNMDSLRMLLTDSVLISKIDTIEMLIDHNIVAELKQAGMTDAWIMKNIGMDRDELLRLKQLSGLAALFADKDFSIPEHDLPTRPVTEPAKPPRHR